MTVDNLRQGDLVVFRNGVRAKILVRRLEDGSRIYRLRTWNAGTGTFLPAGMDFSAEDLEKAGPKKVRNFRRIQVAPV